MTKKALLLYFFAISYIFAEIAEQKFNENNEKIFELIADGVETKDSVVSAYGNAVLISQDVYIIADKIEYDREKHSVKADGNIKIYRGNFLFFTTQKVEIELDDNNSIIEPFYMQDSESGIWVSAKTASSEGDSYGFKDAIISGCSIENPVWHMDATSGSYNDKSSIVSLWNAKINIGKVPVLYFPYLFFSTQDKRTTGFLYPDTGFSNLEGFQYIQPFFIAPKSYWDATITPQVRTSRGAGSSLEIRTVDNEDKVFRFNARYFRNFENYYLDNNLQNRAAYGFELEHENRGIANRYFGLKSIKDDGFHFDFIYMNDLDYLRLQRINSRIKDRIYVSRANYFLQQEENYYGIYFRYFLDLSRVSNSNTFQTLPNLQYHRYYDSIFLKQIQYSLDLQSRNVTRSRGYGYLQNSIALPVSIQTPILNDYISIGFSTDIYGANVKLNDAQNLLDGATNRPLGNTNSYNFLSVNYALSMNVDLAKDYDKIFHTIHFEATFSAPYYRMLSDQLGDESYLVYLREKEIVDNYNRDLPTEQQIQSRIWNSREVVNTATKNRTVNLKLSQYFFNLNAKELFYIRLNQTLNMDNRVSVLENTR